VKAFRCVVAAASAVAAVVLAGCVTVIKARIAWLMCLGLLLLTRSASADDLRKVEYWNYAHCVQENFFMADDERGLKRILPVLCLGGDALYVGRVSTGRDQPCVSV
jgi:hypothetical protein